MITPARNVMYALLSKNKTLIKKHETFLLKKFVTLYQLFAIRFYSTFIMWQSNLLDQKNKYSYL